MIPRKHTKMNSTSNLTSFDLNMKSQSQKQDDPFGGFGDPEPKTQPDKKKFDDDFLDLI